MAILDNNSLYSSVDDLCQSLKDYGAQQLASDLHDAKSTGFTAGEILGEIGLVLRRVREDPAYSRVDIRRRVDEALAYVVKALRSVGSIVPH